MEIFKFKGSYKASDIFREKLKSLFRDTAIEDYDARGHDVNCVFSLVDESIKIGLECNKDLFLKLVKENEDK